MTAYRRRWVDASGAMCRGLHQGELLSDVALGDRTYLRRLLDFEPLTDDDRTSIEVALAQAAGVEES